MTTKESRPTEGEAAQNPQPETTTVQEQERSDLTVTSPDYEVNEEPTLVTGTTVRDILDPEYSVGDDEGLELGPAVISVPIRKPNSAEYFRTHPDFVADRYVLEISEGMDKFVYLITDELIHLAEEHVRKVRIYPFINKRRTVALWVINNPRDGQKRGRKAFDTAVRAAEHGKKAWTKTWWNRDTSTYDFRPARGDLGEPRWPEMTHREMYAIAFEGLIIDHPGHEVLRELWGE